MLKDVRGAGLLLGLQCVVLNTDFQAACMAEGLLTIAAGDNVVRLAPPLIITEAEVEEAVGLLGRAIDRCRAGGTKAP